MACPFRVCSVRGFAGGNADSAIEDSCTPSVLPRNTNNGSARKARTLNLVADMTVSSMHNHGVADRLRAGETIGRILYCPRSGIGRSIHQGIPIARPRPLPIPLIVYA